MPESPCAGMGERVPLQMQLECIPHHLSQLQTIITSGGLHRYCKDYPSLQSLLEATLKSGSCKKIRMTHIQTNERNLHDLYPQGMGQDCPGGKGSLYPAGGNPPACPYQAPCFIVVQIDKGPDVTLATLALSVHELAGFLIAKVNIVSTATPFPSRTF